jgi:hypothetical protein
MLIINIYSTVIFRRGDELLISLIILTIHEYTFPKDSLNDSLVVSLSIEIG